MPLYNRKEIEKQYLTPEQVADRLQIKVETLAEWRRLKKNLNYTKIGAAVRYDPDEVSAYLKANTVNVAVA